jgi:hypothetical protein
VQPSALDRRAGGLEAQAPGLRAQHERDQVQEDESGDLLGGGQRQRVADVARVGGDERDDRSGRAQRGQDAEHQSRPAAVALTSADA